MFKKRLKRPLFSRKSKKTREAKPNHNVDSAPGTSFIEDDGQLESYRSPRRKNRQRNNREYSENYRSPRRKNDKSKRAKEAKEPNYNIDPASHTSLIEDDRELEYNRSPNRKIKKSKKAKEAIPNYDVDSASETSFIEHDRELENYRSPNRKNQKSKKAKEAKQIYDFDSNSDTSFIEYNREVEHYRSPHRKNKQRYHREYSEYYRSPNRRNRQRYYGEYSDDEQYYDEREFHHDYGNQNKYNGDDKMYGYGSQYYRSPESEISYSDDSGSDCEFCNKGRKNRNRRTYSDSEYNYQKHRPKQSARREKSRPPDMGERERPYGRDYNVYIAHQPTGHQAFQNKQQLEQTSTASVTNVNTNETLEDELTETDVRTSGLEYQVYAAGTQQNQVGAFQSQRPAMSHEQLLEITEYNGNIPMIGLKDKSKNSYDNRSPSDIVYLPVIVLNENIALPETKVISYETLANKAGENVDQLLQKNIQLFAASHLDDHNEFARVNNGTKERTLDPSLTHNVHIYAAGLQHTNPFKKKNKSASSISHSKSLLSKTEPSQFDQVTQKSEKEPKGPKRTKSNTSSRSLIGSSRSGSPRGAGFFSKIHIQDLKARRERKRGQKPFGVPAGSAAGPSLYPPYQELENEVHQDVEITPKDDVFDQDESGVTDNKHEQSTIAATGESQGIADKSIVGGSKGASIIVEKSPLETRRGLSRESRSAVGGEYKSLQTEEQQPVLKEEINVETQVESDNQKRIIKSMPTVLPEREEFSKPSEKQKQLKESVSTAPHKRTFTSRWFRKKEDPLINSLGPKENIRHLENGHTIDGISEQYNQDAFRKTTQSFPGTTAQSFPGTTATQIDKRLSKLQRQGSQKIDTLTQSENVPTTTQIDQRLSKLQRQGSQKIDTLTQSENALDQKDIDRNLEQTDNIKMPDGEDYRPLTAMESKLIPSLINVFLAAQIFLGLSLHGTVLKIVGILSDDQT